MLYFLGNCQMDFLGRAVEKSGYPCTYRVLASPFTYNSSPGIIPEDLAGMDAKFGLDKYYHDRKLVHQYQMITPDDPEPQLIVMNLFHENSPLFVNVVSKYIFFVNPEAWQKHPEFEQWMKANFGMVQAKPGSYLKRYREMLVHLRQRFPQVPIIIVSRLSHYPAFGPDPYSYLDGWSDLWRTAGPVLKSWESELGNLAVIEMDRIFGGIWDKSEKKIEAHCPFFKFKLTEENNTITGLHASRDVEHIGSMWPVLAGKIEQYLKEGRIDYLPEEVVPDEWLRAWQPEKFPEDKLIEMLSSGANYQCARAIGSFFLDLGKDYTELLARTAEFTPVCHNTLHMIKTYARIWPNPVLTHWCQVHRVAAAAFIANGPLYTQDYLDRIDEIERLVLAG